MYKATHVIVMAVSANLALGERRASKVQDYLAASSVGRKRITTISYGKERSLDKSRNEASWARNRRAHFLLQTLQPTNTAGHSDRGSLRSVVSVAAADAESE